MRTFFHSMGQKISESDKQIVCFTYRCCDNDLDYQLVNSIETFLTRLQYINEYHIFPFLRVLFHFFVIIRFQGINRKS